MKSLYLLLVTFLLASCATAYVSPESEKLSDKQVAYIKVRNSGSAYFHWSSSIRSVFGMAGQVAPSNGGSSSYKKLRLVPGKYTVYMACQFNNSYSLNDLALNLEVEAGYTYIADCQGIGNNRVKVFLADSYPTGSPPKISAVQKNNSDQQQQLEDLRGLLPPAQQ